MRWSVIRFLRIVVRTDFGRTVTGGHHCLPAVGNVVDIFLVFFVVDERARRAKALSFVLGLVARFSTFYQDFLGLSCIGVFSTDNGTYAGFHLVHVLSACAAGTESVPFDFSLVDFHVEFLGFGQYGHRCGRGMYAALCFRSRYALYAMYADSYFSVPYTFFSLLR